MYIISYVVDTKTMYLTVPCGQFIQWPTDSTGDGPCILPNTMCCLLSA